MFNSYFKIFFFIAGALLLTGCNKHIASTNELKKIAQSHGPYDILAQYSSKNNNSITVYDKKSGVTYIIEGYLQDTGIDGTTFFSYSAINDTYDSAVALQNLNLYEDRLTDYCNKNECKYEINSSAVSLSLYINNTQNDKDIAKGFFDILQDLNTENQLDGIDIYVHSADKLNKLTLPNFTWQTTNEQVLNGFKNLAKLYDKNAEFIRVEEKTFADTGVSQDMLYDNPQRTGKELLKPEDTVNYYYFIINGKEHFFCNFHIYDNNGYWTYSDCGPLWEWNQR